MEFVEVQARTIDKAVAAGLEELGIGERSDAEIEVLQEPDKGFLGMGRTDAIVRVRVKPKPKRRRRRRGKGEGEPSTGRESRASGRSGTSRSGGGSNRNREGGGRETGGSAGGGDRQRARSGARSGGENKKSGRGPDRGGNNRGKERAPVSDMETPEKDINEQAEVVREFLVGLLDAFGLEGEVDVSVDGSFILADIDGEQSEALIGPNASILQSIHELTKTVVQRRTQAGARLRLDIGGYAERRREALTIFAGRLVEQVLSEGEEIMLEPMTPPDRKVVHDAVAALEGVHSFSEGREPRRSVVIAPD